MSVDLPPGFTPESWRALILDNTKFIPTLSFDDEKGIRRTLNTPFGEQIPILRGLNRSRRNFGLKSRNVGWGTIAQARDFHYGWVATDPVKTIVMAHEGAATKRHLERYIAYHESLPPQLQHPISKKNETTYEFADTKAAFVCVTAGGTGGGKGFTFQRAHFTELAYYGQGKNDGAINPRDVYASVTNAMHEGPHFAITIESTSNGPGDFFHEKAVEAQRSPDWEFHFHTWFEHASFTRDLPAGFETTLEERLLAIRHGLTLGQLAWRRSKISESSLVEFNKYYPDCPESAFLSLGEAYFDAAFLTERIQALSPWNKQAWRQYAHPTPDHARYAIGVDVGHGLKKDWSVIQVRDHTGKQVAVWSDNVTPAHIVGEKACEIGIRYGKALICFETGSSSSGAVACERARQLGYDNLYGDKGKLGFETSHQSKQMAFAHARKEILDRAVDLYDRPTCEELVNIRENRKGQIGGASGHHDDHAMAWVLASWAAKRVSFVSSPMSQMKERFGLGRHRLRDTMPQ